MSIRGYVTGPDEGVPGGGPDVKATGRSTGGSVTVMKMVVGEGPPRHTHAREDESIYVLSGVLDVECDGDRFEAGPGSFVFLPRGLPHTFHAVAATASGLLIVTPGGLDEYFAELHAALAGGGGRPEIARIQARYGISRS